ncbi:hypothetical protein AYO21_02294 [Fonsecaea monophora]|uniref:Uncharacterized protein n=1 Tax=Fonsecaea monophora TaxID=254056 RepID=A0A177FGT0_9EURO|nr:hypothetical protein AYO21_02294 [Fonsecaea monophora]OAG43357.1 hypothetical protein AYO21_02294 [Fonsecaea monophora]
MAAITPISPPTARSWKFAGVAMPGLESTNSLAKDTVLGLMDVTIIQDQGTELSPPSDCTAMVHKDVFWQCWSILSLHAEFPCNCQRLWKLCRPSTTRLRLLEVLSLRFSTVVYFYSWWTLPFQSTDPMPLRSNENAGSKRNANLIERSVL